MISCDCHTCSWSTIIRRLRRSRTDSSTWPYLSLGFLSPCQLPWRRWQVNSSNGHIIVLSLLVLWHRMEFVGSVQYWWTQGKWWWDDIGRIYRLVQGSKIYIIVALRCYVTIYRMSTNWRSPCCRMMWLSCTRSLWMLLKLGRERKCREFIHKHSIIMLWVSHNFSHCILLRVTANFWLNHKFAIPKSALLKKQKCLVMQ